MGKPKVRCREPCDASQLDPEIELGVAVGVADDEAVGALHDNAQLGRLQRIRALVETDVLDAGRTRVGVELAEIEPIGATNEVETGIVWLVVAGLSAASVQTWTSRPAPP